MLAITAMHQSPMRAEARLPTSRCVQRGSKGGVRNRLLCNEWDLTALSVCEKARPVHATTLRAEGGE